MGVTVGQLLERCLEECERLDLSPTTVRNYTSQVNGTIRPRLGKIQLHQLTAKHLDDLFRLFARVRGVCPHFVPNNRVLWGYFQSISCL